MADLLSADDRHSADDRVTGESLAMGHFDAHPILNQHDTGLSIRGSSDERFNFLRVVGDIRQGLGGDDDVIPSLRGRVRRRGCVGDRGVDRMRLEVVVSKVACLEGDAGPCDGGVIGTADQ